VNNAHHQGFTAEEISLIKRPQDVRGLHRTDHSKNGFYG